MMSAFGRVQMTIADNALRSEILRYYSFATDRSAVNDSIFPGIQRFHAALESIGVSYSDLNSVDAGIVFSSPTASALFRLLGNTAHFAVNYVEDLITANEELIETVQKEQFFWYLSSNPLRLNATAADKRQSVVNIQ